MSILLSILLIVFLSAHDEDERHALFAIPGSRDGGADRDNRRRWLRSDHNSNAAGRARKGATDVAPYSTVHIEGIVDRVQFTAPEELCGLSLVAEVAEVVVGAHGDARWNTPDGRRPPLATYGEIVSQGYYIYTPVMFSSFTPLCVHEHPIGSSFMTIGGQVGQDSYRMQG